MKLMTLTFLLLSFTIHAQTDYFPPIDGSNEWDTQSPEALGWCPEQIDSLYNFLEERGTKSFIVLHQGKVVLESYFNGHGQDSIWYWASAGKTLAAFLVGCAQDDGDLSIDEPTAEYLGAGWTAMSSEQEMAITVKHQLSMSTGMDFTGNLNCLEPACLTYDVDPNESWYYHNAPYRLLQDVVSQATGTNFNLYTLQRLGNRIGMGGLWVDYVRWGKARDMARFGILMANKGSWNGDQVLADQDYWQAMISPSQSMNKSYGYLWWLNGQESFILPSIQQVFSGSLIAKAPADMYAAMGKNDQRIYVVPSQELVVVRQGEDTGQSVAGPSSFDNDLWERMAALACTTTSTGEIERNPLNLFPNPAVNSIAIGVKGNQSYHYQIHSIDGQLKQEATTSSSELNISSLSKGVYLLRTSFSNSPVRFVKL